MRRLLIVLAFLWAAPAWAYQETVAFDEEPLLSVIVEPDDVFAGGAWVQGEIVVTIRVSSLYPFEALNVEMPVIEGAVVETLLKPRMREVRSYAGKGYVLERVIAIYPQRSGRLAIPPVRATGTVSPRRNEPLNFVEESPEIVLDVGGQHPAFAGDWWMVSRVVTMTETWSKPVDELRKGDVVRREITIKAAGVPHTRIKAPEHKPTRGIALTDAGTTGTTQRTTDGVVGTLTRAWDLRIGVRDIIYVAPLGVHYWHPGEGAGRKAGVKGYRVEPLPEDEAAIAAALMFEAEARHDGARLLALAGAGVLAAPLVLLALAWGWTILPTGADRRLRAAAAGAEDPAAIYRAVQAWLAEAGLDPRNLDLPETSAHGALMRRLFAGSDRAVDGAAVARDLVRAGRRVRTLQMRDSLSRITSGLIGRPARLIDKS